MLKFLSNSFSALKSYQNSLDVTAHNLANVNTPAFKENQASFQELPYRSLAERRLPHIAGQPPGNLLSGSGTVFSSTVSRQEQGAHTPSEGKMHLAIEGEGFFRVLRGDGEFAYTRSGTFALDSAGNLVLPGGERLDFNLQDTEQDLGAEIETSTLTVDQEGNVYAYTLDQQEDMESLEEMDEENDLPAGMVMVGELSLYRFANTQGLSNVGGNLLLPSEASGPPLEGAPGEDGFGVLKQGFLEESNVDFSRQMTDLIRGQRALQASSRTMVAADELWSLTLQLQA